MNWLLSKYTTFISLSISTIFYGTIWYFFGLNVMFLIFGTLVITNILTLFGTIWWLSRDINIWNKQHEMNETLTTLSKIHHGH